jgi:hypothetical protein
MWGRGRRGGEGTTRQSKSKEGVGGLGSFPSQRGGLEVQKLFELGEGGLTSKKNRAERERKQIEVQKESK